MIRIFQKIGARLNLIFQKGFGRGFMDVGLWPFTGDAIIKFAIISVFVPKYKALGVKDFLVV